jgi:hypothetical protein
VNQVSSDATATGLTGEARRLLESRFVRAQRLGAFANPLLAPDGSSAGVQLVLLRDRDQAATIERVLGPANSPRQAIARIYPSLRISGRNFRPRGMPENTVLDKFSLSAPLPQIEFFTTPDPKAEPDARVASGPGWGVIRLLQAGAVRRADGKEWDTVIHLADRGTDLVLAVTIVFDQPLPALDRWPGSAP